MWPNSRQGSAEGAGPWGLAEQAEPLELCPGPQMKLDGIMSHLPLLTSCTRMSWVYVKQGEPDGSACGHTAGAGRPARTDTGGSGPSITDMAGGALCLPGAQVSASGGHRPTWSRRAGRLCEGRCDLLPPLQSRGTHGPGTGRGRACIAPRLGLRPRDTVPSAPPAALNGDRGRSLTPPPGPHCPCLG